MTTEVLRGVAEGAIKGLSDLVPGIAEYQYHSSMMYAVIAGVIIIISLIVMVIGFRAGTKNRWNTEKFATVCIAIGVLIIALVFFVSEMEDVYLAKYFPEKLVLRELRHLLENY